METKKDDKKLPKKNNKKPKDSVIIPIKKTIDRNEIIERNEIQKLESGIYHDEHGKLLYKPDEEFESCCFKCDKPLCLYIGKMFISVSVLFFCMFMLQFKENSAEFYTGTIAGLLGHFLNNSSQQSDNKKRENQNRK